jgi:hypothetical protein
MMYKSFLLLATASTLVLSACTSDSIPSPMAGSGASTPPPAQTASAVPPGSVMNQTNVPGSQNGLPPATDLLNAPMSTVAKTPDVETRLTRLEIDVEVMKGQIQLVRPILEKMPALQDKLSELVSELQRIDARVAATKSNADMMPEVRSGKEPSSEKPMKAANAPTTAVPSPMTKPAPKMAPIISPTLKKPDAPATTHSEQKELSKSAHSVSNTSIVTPSPEMAATSSLTTPPSKGLMAVRVGEDMEKTRVVLDVGGPAAFQYDLDNTEKIMIIDLNIPVANAGMGEFDKSPLVASYSTQSIAPNKSRVILQLRAPVQVLKTSTLPPNADKPDRVILDLIPAAR